MGLPGSGKTTLAHTLQSLTAAARLSSDDFRMLLFPNSTFSPGEHDTLYRILDASMIELISAGYSVIYDANLNRKLHRQEKYDLARTVAADVRLWWVDVPVATAKTRRSREQNAALIPAGETAERMFDRIQAVFEAPTDGEIATLVDGTRISSEYIASLLATPDVSRQ